MNREIKFIAQGVDFGHKPSMKAKTYTFEKHMNTHECYKIETELLKNIEQRLLLCAKDIERKGVLG